MPAGSRSVVAPETARRKPTSTAPGVESTFVIVHPGGESDAAGAPVRAGVLGASQAPATGVATGPTARSATGRPMLALPRLVERLSRSPAAPLALLHAPAGYGKTACLEEWQVVDHRPFAWVRCKPAHRDGLTFLSAVATTLADVRPADPQLHRAVRRRDPDAESLLAALRSFLGGRGPSFVLVLDDVHLLTRARQRDVGKLIEALPAGSQIAVATRIQPALPLGRMRAEHRLVELGSAELAMTRGESAAVLKRLVPQLTSAQCEILSGRVEGWPAGLHLAGFALSEQADLPAAVAAFGGDDRAVVDYLRDEVVAALSPEEAEFLTRSSLLDELSGGSCDVALERSDSASVLRRLAHERALVIPLDRRDGRYRLNRLLGAMLRSELRHEHPNVESSIRARASRWHADRGEHVPAIEQALAAGAVASAGELIWNAFPELSGRGQIGKLASWLDEVGDDRIAASVPLALSAAHRHIACGQDGQAAHWARVAAAAVKSDGALRTRFRADLHLLDAALGADGVVEMGKHAARAAELYPAESPWQCAAYLYRGVSSQLSGQPERAIPLLEEAARRGAIASPIIQATALAQLGMIAIDDERPAQASRLVAHASEQVERCGLGDYGSMVLTYAVAALTRSHESRIDRAHALARQSERLLEELPDLHAWYAAEVRSILARTWLRLDELERAELMLEAATEQLDRAPDAATLRQWLAVARESLQAARTRRNDGDRALTRAELRTLQYLPSHLSFREIAAALCLSANTVKTQSRAVYRKLGVSSRSAAVKRAREAGLLTEQDRTHIERNG